MIATAALDDILGAFLRPLARPPKPRSLIDFARTLTIQVVDPDTGADKWERFAPETHPGQWETLRAFAAGGLEVITLGPVQDGKTTVTIVVLALYCLVELRQSCSLMLPDLHKAVEVWSEKIVPVMEHSGLAHLLPADRGVGGGGRGGVARSMLLATGARIHLVGAGGTNESAQAAFTVRFALADEASKIRPRMLKLGQQRTAAYDMFGRFLRTSTLRDGELDTTYAGWKDSTASRNAFACPYCVMEGHATGGWQIWDHTQLQFDRTSDQLAESSARLVCRHDANHRLTEGDRRKMLRAHRCISRGQTVAPDGSIVGPMPETMSRGFLWTCFDSPLKSLGKIAIEWRKAEITLATTGSHDAMRILFHEQFVFPYTGDKLDGDIPHQLTRAYLVARCDTAKFGPCRKVHVEGGDSRHMALCPKSAIFTVVFVDVQRGGQRSPGRLYWLVRGFTADFQGFDFAWGHTILSPPGRQANTVELYQGLDRLRDLLKSIEFESAIPMARKGIDVGDRQDELRIWLMRNPDWIACKGSASVMRPEPDLSERFDIAGWIYRRQQEAKGGRRWWLHLIDVDSVRRMTLAAYLVPPGQPGAIQLPKGLTVQDTLVRHLCAKVEISDGRGGTRWSDREKDRAQHPEWQLRHDFQDCSTGCEALGYEYLRHRIVPAERIISNHDEDRPPEREQSWEIFTKPWED